MNTKSIIKTYLNNNISKISSLVIFTILTIAFKIFNPICMKLIIDFSTKGDFKEYGNMVILFTVLMGASTVLSMVFDSIRQAKTTGFGNDITVELRTMSFQTIMKSELYEVNKISNEELSETVVNSSKILGDDYTSGKLIKLLYNALYLVAMLITMIVFNPTFAILSTLSLPLFYFIYKYLSRIADKRQETYTKVNNEHQDIINDRMQQLKIIKTRNGIDKENDLYEKTLSDNKKIFARNINIINTKNKFVPSLFVGISWFVLFLITCYEVYQSQNMEWIMSEIGSIIGCVALSPKVISTFKLMLDLYYTKIDTDAECAKLDKIFALKSERRLENVPSLEEVHSLKFNNVSFDYSTYGVSDKVLLDKVEFEVKKGEKLGIIGLPGSGKTTHSKVLMKEYDCEVISTDKVRQTYPGIVESDVFPTVYKLCAEEIKLGHNVILDATHITPKVRKRTFDALDQYEVEYEKIAVYLNTPVEECLKRVKIRKLLTVFKKKHTLRTK